MSEECLGIPPTLVRRSILKRRPNFNFVKPLLQHICEWHGMVWHGKAFNQYFAFLDTTGLTAFGYMDFSILIGNMFPSVHHDHAAMACLSRRAMGTLYCI